ncbi:hypothetical protein LOK49_LG09G01739 [Camellia lanceoleosa]|uniref:Uncharacterized protein n=1 Tax=Camellia lanceoleosa TaxID=1840588 RepID=A0ACC0GFF5_9ERIC|nr:hypothetical protein LOK49_LG09G01739 [Camellia lanceoleosa]
MPSIELPKTPLDREKARRVKRESPRVRKSTSTTQGLIDVQIAEAEEVPAAAVTYPVSVNTSYILSVENLSPVLITCLVGELSESIWAMVATLKCHKGHVDAQLEFLRDGATSGIPNLMRVMHDPSFLNNFPNGNQKQVNCARTNENEAPISK